MGDRCVKTETSSGFEYSCQFVSSLTRLGYTDNGCSIVSSIAQWNICICDTDGCNNNIGKFYQSKVCKSIPYIIIKESVSNEIYYNDVSFQ